MDCLCGGSESFIQGKTSYVAHEPPPHWQKESQRQGTHVTITEALILQVPVSRMG